jgi:hypothetical protein
LVLDPKKKKDILEEERSTFECNELLLHSGCQKDCADSGGWLL